MGSFRICQQVPGKSKKRLGLFLLPLRIIFLNMRNRNEKTWNIPIWASASCERTSSESICCITFIDFSARSTRLSFKYKWTRRYLLKKRYNIENKRLHNDFNDWEMNEWLSDWVIEEKKQEMSICNWVEIEKKIDR